MTRRVLPAAVVITLLCGAAPRAQTPNLTKPQRELLQALIAAVDAAQAQPESTDVTWQSHVMRASDGSHYVAFTIEPPRAQPMPTGAVMLYVRLATSPAGTAQPTLERSAIREWLAGSRTDPRLLPHRSIAIGEMPAFGAGSTAVRGSTPSTGSTDLSLMALERERARQAKEEQDKKRTAELKGIASAARELLPFEDFDLASQSVLPDGQRVIARALTAGPGEYDLFVAWADPSAQKPLFAVHVIHKPLKLLAARTAGLTTSSIILADSVTVRPAPYGPTEQASHPYSIGLMEITPSRTNRYGRDRNLAVAFQIINAASTDAGMPDIAVDFRIVRVSGDRESPVASLKPQVYNSSSLPADFNLKLGHPLFAAVSAPLATLARGDYRLKIGISDKISGTSAGAESDFSIVGTPASLLTEAPALGPAFKREVIQEPDTLAWIVDHLTPPTPSSALARALTTARSGRLADLLIAQPVDASETGVRSALTGLAFLSIGDASAATHFQRALDEGAPIIPTQFLLGCARAAGSRDADAIAAWTTIAGEGPTVTKQLLLDAHLRRNDVAHATELIAASAGSTTPAWIRSVAATHMAARRERDAIAVLEGRLTTQPGDEEARWLLLHALYAQAVRATAPPAKSDIERFRVEAQIYIDRAGANAALAREWLSAISSF